MLELISRFSIAGLGVIVIGLIAWATMKLRADDAKRGQVCRICGAPVPPVDFSEVPTCVEGHANPW